MPLILAQAPNAILVWLGEGSARAALESAARQSGHGDRLRLLGQIADPAEFYWATDMFVLPSYLEGHSLALLEAAAHGCPIVTTRTAGDGAMLRHDRDAMVYADGNVAALSRKIIGVLGDRSLAARLGSAAWAWANEHAEARMLERYHRLIEAIGLDLAQRATRVQ
jgi:glycosyltransferase involved in cell wall biosynthesis